MIRTQLYWNVNLTVDDQRQGWANFIELGPGIRLRTVLMPPSVYLMLDSMQGAYLIHGSYPVARFSDLRAGVWYALPVSLALICGLAGAAPLPYFGVLSDDAGSMAGDPLVHWSSGQAGGACAYLRGAIGRARIERVVCPRGSRRGSDPGGGVFASRVVRVPAR